MRHLLTDPDAVATAIKSSDLSLRQLEWMTRGLEYVAPGKYLAVSRTTFSALGRGLLPALEGRRAAAVCEVLHIDRALFVPATPSLSRSA